MFVQKKYPFLGLLQWTIWEILAFTAIGFTATILYKVLGFTFLQLPWTPIALIGTAVAFLIGFQNNAAYGRIWEARKIWGGIVNYSRSWGVMTGDMVTNEYAPDKIPSEELTKHKRILVHRHIAWLTALRHAMRCIKKPWEVLLESRTNRQWHEKMAIPEREKSLEQDLQPLLSAEELKTVLGKSNKSTAILTLQSHHLRALKEQGLIWEFSFLELEGIIKEFFNLQGKSERIKNFPYPRQYATLGYDFVRVFIMLLPFAVIPEFSKLGEGMQDTFPLISHYFIWLSVPFIVIVSWVFHTMHRIGTVGENPFEGSPNDVPISSISRGIEIDLREMLGEDKATIPKQYPIVHNIQM